MKRIKDVAYAFAMLVLTTLLGWGCDIPPIPVAPTDPSGYTCADAALNVSALGCVKIENFTTLCIDAQKAEASVKVTLPVGCMASAKTCAELRACR